MHQAMVMVIRFDHLAESSAADRDTFLSPTITHPAPRLHCRRRPRGGRVARAHEAHEACQLDLGVPKLRETRGSGETGSGKKRYPTDARREAALRRVAVERQISAWILRKAPIFAKHP